MTATRYFFHIGYQGTAYRGWQRQARGTSVQGVIEGIMTKALKQQVSIMGCGRTDALVHASQFFFHSDLKISGDYDLLFRLNKQLPADISMFDMFPMAPRQHARYDATRRTYDYFIHTRKDPFIDPLSSLYLTPNLHLEKMQAAARLLLKYNDYHALCTVPGDHHNTLCQISSAQWFHNRAGDKFRFQISANRFLGKMVRILVGNMLKIGLGEMTVDELEHRLITKRSKEPLNVAFPQGLYLSKVDYPYLDITPRWVFDAQPQSDVWISV